MGRCCDYIRKQSVGIVARDVEGLKDEQGRNKSAKNLKVENSDGQQSPHNDISYGLRYGGWNHRAKREGKVRAAIVQECRPQG